MSGIKRTAKDREFSLMVRDRDSWTCQVCDQMYIAPTKGLHTAHMFSRACKVCTSKKRGQSFKPHYCTRLDPDNAMALCYGHHQWMDSHPDEKEELFRQRLGTERFEALSARAHGKRDR